ncbi:MAG: hypothetical protein ACOYOK_09205 [Pseudobdellovibrionaceae bacterium]
MEFRDYAEKLVLLMEDSWAHIKENHPEIELDQIELTLKSPLEVRKSNSATHLVELYYQTKMLNPEKIRFICVVVKNLSHASYVLTAMTTAKIKDGEVVYKKEGVIL